MSGWEEIEEQVGGAFLSLADAPTEFIGKLVDMTVKKDSRGNNALFLTIEVVSSGGKKKLLVQKFTRAFLGTLTDAFEKLKIPKAEALGKTYKWKQRQIGRGNPRWIPVEVVK
jgi:hypothetical protein